VLAKEIRKKFLEFFKSKGHEIVESDTLVPRADPSLLFTSAGMNQFKEQFLGHNVTYQKAASSQKCLRTADLDKVGNTPSHHTFFEMLGNFSFGNYFKKEAIEWAWEFMTETLGIKKEKLWVSVYEEDREAYEIWRGIVKVPEKKIVKMDAKENFWPSNAPADGPNGPCGPCSEIFYDRGDGKSVEVWNLVFTQFDRKEGGKLGPLPNKNIDTGMGLERIAAVMQGVKTNFETDLFAPIIAEVKVYNPKLKREDLNAIADHMRAVTFAIAGGVEPSNEERGYVVRKLIRRSYMRGKGKKPFLYNIVPRVVEIMKDAYPELSRMREEVCLIVKEEEKKFAHTLSAAAPALEEGFKKARGGVLEGDKIFKLVDTYGLPLEAIEEQARKKKIKLDSEGFRKLMAERRRLSRKKSKIAENIFELNLFAKAPKPEFSGKAPLEAKIVMIKFPKAKDKINQGAKGDEADILTSPQSSLFYTEAGGQAGDSGVIKRKGEGRVVARILDTYSFDGRIIHKCIVESRLAKGDDVIIELDRGRKKYIAKNHTATHLLQAALRKVLGAHVRQAGSRVDEERIRFDFTHMKKLTDRELEKVESIVNECIKKNIAVEKGEKTLAEAKEEGAIALFGEKYADRVRVVSVGGFSKEVCGGTHVDNAGDIDLFKITRESSVAAGVRRIEALTARRAREWLEESEKQKLKSEELLKEKEREKKREKERLKKAEVGIDALLEKARDIKGVKIIIEEVENANMGILRSLSDTIKAKTKSAFIFLGSREGHRVNIVLTGTEDLVSNGLNASEMIKSAAKIVNGAGGGRADFAQAGGRDPSGLGKVFEFIEKSAADIIGGI